MPKDTKPDLFDRECERCGHDGMKQTQAPGRDGPRDVFKCPECGHTDTAEDDVGGFFASKL
jgi:DNA-directed RNA polymerase subunit M/transcription elongation factor TFIIS